MHKSAFRKDITYMLYYFFQICALSSLGSKLSKNVLQASLLLLENHHYKIPSISRFFVIMGAQ